MTELIAIQNKLKAPKSNFNKFGNYSYRSLEDIQEALKPLMNENGCFLTINDEIVQVGERYYVKATVTLFNSDGQSISVSAMAREEETKKGMDASQITGATSSYARKYALNGLFAIDDTKDADATNTHDNAPAKAPAPSKATEEDALKLMNEFKAKLESFNIDPRKFLERDGVDMKDTKNVYAVVRKYMGMNNEMFIGVLENWEE